ncbi:hypothetical protein ACN4EG_25245 [Alkalinema pantanalense CENA528]
MDDLITLEEICNLPFDSPEAEAEFEAFLDEMAELAANLSEDELPAE